MAWILTQKEHPDVVYCGENNGWKDTAPPPPPDPMADAQKFATQEEADKYAANHGMSAVAKDIG